MGAGRSGTGAAARPIGIAVAAAVVVVAVGSTTAAVVVRPIAVVIAKTTK